MPSSTEPTTPRPWKHYTKDRWNGGDICSAANQFDCATTSGPDGDVREADAALIVEAVNNYDRLKKIEAAARQFVADWSDTTYDRASFAVDRDEWNVLNLRHALEIE